MMKSLTVAASLGLCLIATQAQATSVSVADVSVTEGNSGTTDAVFNHGNLDLADQWRRHPDLPDVSRWHIRLGDKHLAGHRLHPSFRFAGFYTGRPNQQDDHRAG